MLETAHDALDIKGAIVRKEQLEAELGDPEIWTPDNQELALAHSREHGGLEVRINRYMDLLNRLRYQRDLMNLVTEERDLEGLDVVAQDVEGLAADAGVLEGEILMSGEHDARPAIVSLQAGAGDLEAEDLVANLLSMYEKWARRSGVNSEISEVVPAEHGGLRRATIVFPDEYAYGWLVGEQGWHRMIRHTPHGKPLRRTSWASVEVLPVLPEAEMPAIPDSDLKIDVFRASGPGGQSVNTTDSAVRITHLPTNTVVTSQAQRSQLQNRQTAMVELQSRLAALREAEQDDALATLRLGFRTSSKGQADRTYTLDRDELVDHRTGYTSNNASGVLEGNLHPALVASLRWRALQAAPQLAEGVLAQAAERETGATGGPVVRRPI